MSRAAKSVRIAQIAAFLRASYFYLPVISLYFMNGGASVSTLVLAQVLYSAVTVISELPTGVFADKFGQKSALVTGYGFSLAALVSALLFGGTIRLIAFSVLFALGDAFISGSEQAYIFEQTNQNDDSYKKQYSLLLGMQALAVAVSSSISAAMLSLIADLRFTVLIGLTVAAYASALILSLMLRRRPLRKSDRSEKVGVLRTSLQEIKRNQALKVLFVVSICTVSGEYFLYSVYQPYFVENGVSTTSIGVLLSIGALGNFLVLKYFYKLTRHFRFETLIFMYSLIMAALFGALFAFREPAILMFGFVLLRSLFNSLSPLISNHIQAVTHEGVHATVLSAASLGQSLVNILLRIVLAAVVAKAGIASGLGAFGVYLSFGSLFSFWYMRRHWRHGRSSAR